MKNFNKMIQIPRASFDDAGEYVCTASNKRGYIAHTITVSVKGEIFQSIFSDCLVLTVALCGDVETTCVFAIDSGSLLAGEAHGFGFGP